MRTAYNDSESYMHSICHCSVTFNTLHIVLFKSNRSLFFTMATDKSSLHQNSPQIPFFLLFSHSCSPSTLAVIVSFKWRGRERKAHSFQRNYCIFVKQIQFKLNFNRPIMIQSREKTICTLRVRYRCECVCMCLCVCVCVFLIFLFIEHTPVLFHWIREQ